MASPMVDLVPISFPFHNQPLSFRTVLVSARIANAEFRRNLSVYEGDRVSARGRSAF